MKKCLSFAVILFIAMFGAFSNLSAQTKKIPEPPALMYEITGNGLTKPSYLFGTMHLICPTDMISMSKFDKYVSNSEQVIMELDFDDQTEMQSMSKVAFLPDGKTLADYLTEEKYTKIGDVVKEFLGIPIENVKNLHPIFLGALVTTSPKVLGCSSPGSYELSFLASAIAKKKPIEGLETVVMQLASVNSSPVEKQAENLYKFAADPQKSIEEFKELMKVYKLQDAVKIYDTLQTSLKEDPAFSVELLDKRNADWIPKIEKAVKGKSSFIAVGAAHLGGEQGVLNLLRAKNYVLKPIRF